jgi:UDP-N-acetylglucosamine--N-acetylmuramyl-(pentapeptide) pyrophosphoryl-undecaprenol N-acetylglucosamine transferase
MLGHIADRIFVTFAQSQRWFPAGRTLVTGNPIRAAFFQGGMERKELRPNFTILVFGGRQGAQRINRMMKEALEHLRHLKSRLAFIHQTGEGDGETVAAAYREQGFTAEVVPFITDMASAYRRADLLICRAGATTIAEITAGGKASILIPYPFAVNDHQSKNAEVLARAGAAEAVAERDLSGARLASLIDRLQGDPEALRRMAGAAGRMGNPDAAKTIVDACLLLLGQQRGTDHPQGET